MARITEIEIFMANLQPKVKRVDAIQSFVSQETPFVRVTDEDGASGLGYSYTIGQGGPAVMSLLRETLVPQLIGREAEDIGRIWRDLLFSTHATAVGAITSLALAAIDTALWDLRCKRAGLPLWRMLGGAKASVPMYTTEGGWLHIPTEDLVSDAVEAKSLGFSGSKIKIGRPHLSEDRERLAAVREAVGPDYEIMVDANQCFSRAEATRRAKVLEEMGIAWFEEPMPADDVMEHVRLAASTSVPIAVGESMYSLSQFKDYLTTGGASIVQVDVARIGGITPWMKVAHMAEAFNVPVCPHFLMELHVSLVCAIPNAPWLEYIPQIDNLTAEPMRMEAGRAFASDAPGLGIAWDEDLLNAARIDGLSARVTN
ncbi:mandelate racemase/muconate lactonizing enzyme family protein [Hoeflea prorocentri]|uniref:Mandelate racemase/muconate lactonizing enzyme family protein n=1 Tax=Hoeflea prorocentri TaxID=1922333 RepID=A0A9X3ZI18_9HYPH|nr:mandelate racemase/muconate lactonizing enzyme family protein [Hoeflea prorocentri]MCY6381959.1 mandelate racemase/muconate lactonizing enzyme family protein [Hoeflea prorocentri]MDA5399759.1 mandelate racemase/muconate lactonizing enzyme family protein [Hoeflea prorocentri]